MGGGSYEDLKVWERAHGYVLKIYRLTSTFPDIEKYNLTSQLRRSAVSIPTNIAEGKGRYSDAEFVKFLIIARGSLEENKYLLKLSCDLDLIDSDIYEVTNSENNEIGRMLNGLITSIKKQ